MKKSYFDGTAGQYFILSITNILISFFTLGLGYPWTLLRKIRWQSKHYVISGKRFVFKGELVDFI